MTLNNKKCEICTKDFEMMIFIFLNTNKTEVYCYSCFSSKILKNPYFVNQINSIIYTENIIE